MTSPEHYQSKSPEYFSSEHTDVINLVTGHRLRILEIGCAEGHTGALLKRLGIASEVHGIELIEEVAERARARLDSVIAGNLETLEFPFEPGSFDCVIATEVLEHLVDPGRLLQRLTAMLQPGGYVVASTPNIRHIRVLWSLMTFGDWHYSDSGPLDRTHLRFFTKRSFVRLFAESGYIVDDIRPVLLSKADMIVKATFNILEEFLAFRYYCKARPIGTQR